MSKEKFVCPRCGGQLAFWKEEYIETQIKISKRTGKLYKKKKVVRADIGDMQGIICTSCNLSHNWISEIDEEVFQEELLDEINDINFANKEVL